MRFLTIISLLFVGVYWCVVVMVTVCPTMAGPGSDGAISELQPLQDQQVARFVDNVKTKREREPSKQENNLTDQALRV